MRQYYTLIAILTFNIFYGQNPKFIEKYIQNEQYTMTFFSVKDTTKTVIGNIQNSIILKDNQILQSMVMQSNFQKSDFIDITMYHLKNLKPFFHSSNNEQRLLTIHYGDTVHAMSRNVADGLIKTYVDIMVRPTHYYDSSSYQNILRWLDLREGFQEELKIYNYDPNSKSGLMKVKITGVSSELYNSKKLGTREVWKVSEVYGETAYTTVHYIDKQDRRLWKMEINQGRLVMIRDE